MPEPRQIACCLCDRWHNMDYICYDVEVDRAPDCQICGDHCRGHATGILTGIDPAAGPDRTAVVSYGPGGVISHLPITPMDRLARIESRIADQLGIPSEYINGERRQVNPIVPDDLRTEFAGSLHARAQQARNRLRPPEPLPTIEDLNILRESFHPFIAAACNIPAVPPTPGTVITNPQALRGLSEVMDVDVNLNRAEREESARRALRVVDQRLRDRLEREGVTVNPCDIEFRNVPVVGLGTIRVEARYNPPTPNTMHESESAFYVESTANGSNQFFEEYQRSLQNTTRLPQGGIVRRNGTVISTHATREEADAAYDQGLEERGMPRLNRNRPQDRDTSNVPLRSALDVALDNAATVARQARENAENALHTARSTPQAAEPFATPASTVRANSGNASRVQEMAGCPERQPTLIYPRQSGRTSVALAGVEQSPDAVYIAHTENHAEVLREYNPEIANRIFGPQVIHSNLFLNIPVVFDHVIYEQAIQWAGTHANHSAYDTDDWYAVCRRCRRKFNGPVAHECGRFSQTEFD